MRDYKGLSFLGNNSRQIPVRLKGKFQCDFQCHILIVYIVDTPFVMKDHWSSAHFLKNLSRYTEIKQFAWNLKGRILCSYLVGQI